jgi:hypothetical protein
MIFYNQSAGFEYLKKIFSGMIDHIDLKNRDRHMVLYLKDGRRFYCLFKREFIHSFNDYAKSLLNLYPDLRGHGESINVQWCRWASMNNCILLYVYEDGSIYQINPKIVTNVSVIHTQKQDNSYIIQNKREIINEEEYWFPVKLLMPFNTKELK